MASMAPTRPVEQESQLQDEIAAECQRRGWIGIRSRMDRPTTYADGISGVCDFVIVADGGRVFFIEAKTKSKPTSEQLAFLAWVRKLGHVGAIVRNIEEFHHAINNP